MNPCDDEVINWCDKIIATIKAGITLRDKGGLFLTISDMKLSKELKEFFDKRK